MNALPLQPPQEATDIFSISDQVLADRLQFIEEIGFGNWGSVWACRPKQDPSAPEAQHAPPNTKIAVKLVHRSKTPTTAARVRSLWNEMKVVRALKHEPHPSIIPFYSFIITPSYALITMAFHPRLVPVEVAEHHAKPWFLSLLSGIDFLHKRGVVHNDIKPANIMLSAENDPVLVDFGFAERYDVSSSDAFHSNLSYGTPEYLSPERARGLPHDTRKSDVWSLGISFFEILVGRTPFEHSEGEQFSSKEDLEKYWSRTMKGRWVGSWKMSPSIEKLLRRMISPNADLRCTASEAMADAYWSQAQNDAPVPSHKKTASTSYLRPVSMVDGAALSEGLPVLRSRVSKDTATPRGKAERAKLRVSVDKENVSSPPNLIRDKSRSASALGTIPRHKRAQSQSLAQLTEARGVSQTRKPAPSVIATLSPIKHTPPTVATPVRAMRSTSSVLREKENVLQTANANGATRTTRKPLGPRKPSPPSTPVMKRPARERKEQDENTPVTERKDKERNRRSRVFTDVVKVNQGTERQTPRGNKVDSVTERMREWERERKRIREMERVEEQMKEAEEERQREQRKEEELKREFERHHALEVELEKQRAKEAELEEMQQREVERQQELDKQKQEELELEREREREREREELERPRAREAQLHQVYTRLTQRREPTSSPPRASQGPTPLSPLIEESESKLSEIEDRSGNESGLSLLRQSLKVSLDMTRRLYKSSTQALGRAKSSSPGRDDAADEAESRMSISDRASWEGEEIIREAKSSLPVVRQAVRNEQLAVANQLDRMTIWIKNVEKVVEDARQNFAAASSTTLPPLPVAPVSRRSSSEIRAQRCSRVPRRILAANHIFDEENNANLINAPTNDHDQSIEYRRSWMNETIPTIPSQGHSHPSMSSKLPTETPTTPSHTRRRATIGTRSPEFSKKPALEIDISPSRRREKSRSQHDLGRPITPVTRLQFEVEQLSKPVRMPRLSTLVDKNLFIADNGAMKSSSCASFGERFKIDELAESPQHVESYPSRLSPQASVALDTSGKKHVEGVYDRFLMSTTGVKRVGRGYQSDNVLPASQIPQLKTSTSRRNPHFFMSTRKPMPPPVSSDDLRRAASIGEFGTVTSALAAVGASKGDDNSNSVSIVRRALKAISVKR